MSNTYQNEVSNGFPLLPAAYYADTLPADKVDAAFDGLSQMVQERMTISLADPGHLKFLYYLNEDDSVTSLAGIDLTDPQQKARLVNMAAANRLYGFSAGQKKLQQISLLGMDGKLPRLQSNYVYYTDDDDELEADHADAVRERLANEAPQAPTPPEEPAELQTPPPPIKWYMWIAHFFSKNAYKSIFDENETYRRKQTEYRAAQRDYEQKRVTFEQKRASHEQLCQSYQRYSHNLKKLQDKFSKIKKSRSLDMSPTAQDEEDKKVLDLKKTQEKIEYNKTHQPKIFRDYHEINERENKIFMDREQPKVDKAWKKYDNARKIYQRNDSDENYINVKNAKKEYSQAFNALHEKIRTGQAPMRHEVLPLIPKPASTKGKQERKEHNTGIEQKVELEKKSIIERFPQRDGEIADLTAELTEKYRDKTDAEKLAGIGTLIDQTFTVNPYTVKGAASIRAAKALYDTIQEDSLEGEPLEQYDKFGRWLTGMVKMDKLLQNGRDAELKLSQLGGGKRPENYNDLVKNVLVCHAIRRNMINKTPNDIVTNEKLYLSNLCGKMTGDGLTKRISKGYNMDALYAKSPAEILDMAHGAGGFDTCLKEKKIKNDKDAIKVEVYDVPRISQKDYSQKDMSKEDYQKTVLKKGDEKKYIGSKKAVDTFHI